MIEIKRNIDGLKDFEAWSRGAERLHNLQLSNKAYKYVQDMVEEMARQSHGINETDLNDFLAYDLDDILTDKYGEEMAEQILTGEYKGDNEYSGFLEEMEATQEFKSNLENCKFAVDTGVAKNFSEEGKAVALAMEFYTAHGTNKSFDEVATEINLLYPKNQSPLEAQDIERIADLVAKDMNGDLKENINYKEEMNKADVANKFEFENSDVQSNEAANKQKARKQ